MLRTYPGPQAELSTGDPVMNTQVKQLVKIQLPGSELVTRLADVLGQFLAERRARRALAAHLRHLRALDHHALSDMGIDVTRLHDINPSIVLKD
jgi:hypothetical protein